MPVQLDEVNIHISCASVEIEIYSPLHIVQITDFLGFLHGNREELYETFTKFYSNLVLTKNIKIIHRCVLAVKNQQK